MVVFSLTIVRHGETSYNRKSIIQGQTDIPLSSTGVQQAKLVAARLEYDHFTHVFSSDLSRAVQTAQNIVDGNKVCRCTIMKDKRLRERKFGEFEGKQVKDLMAAAKKMNKSSKHWREYNPAGSETYKQLKDRAVSFFRDLCKLLVAFINDVEDTDYIPGSIKRRHGGSLGRNSGGVGKHLSSCRRSQSFCGVSSMTNYTEIDINDQKKRKCEKITNSHGFDSNEHKISTCDNLCQDGRNLNSDEDQECLSNNSEKKSEGIGSDRNSVDLSYSDSQDEYRNCNDSNSVDIKDTCSEPGKGVNKFDNIIFQTHANGLLDEDISDALDERNQSNSSSSGFASLHSENHGENDSDSVIFYLDQEDKKSSQIYSKETVKNDTYEKKVSAGTNKDMVKGKQYPHYDGRGSCPNVSLSPLVSHRLSSISSISSGRNSSFDDFEGHPPTVADVLIVSHGGLIRELLQYFMNELDCSIPGGKGRTLGICQNCSISKFMVSIPNILEDPTVSCVFINEKDHLDQMNMEALEGQY